MVPSNPPEEVHGRTARQGCRATPPSASAASLREYKNSHFLDRPGSERKIHLIRDKKPFRVDKKYHSSQTELSMSIYNLATYCTSTHIISSGTSPPFPIGNGEGGIGAFETNRVNLNSRSGDTSSSDPNAPGARNSPTWPSSSNC